MLSRVLGTGEFGSVQQATWTKESGEQVCVRVCVLCISLCSSTPTNTSTSTTTTTTNNNNNNNTFTTVTTTTTPRTGVSGSEVSSTGEHTVFHLRVHARGKHPA